jgi:hypothetical protein
MIGDHKSYASEVLSSFSSSGRIQGANQTINENCSLDIFSQIGNTSELTKENITNELVIFKVTN